MSWQGRVQRPLVFITGLAAVATLLAYGGRWSWACEVLVNFRTHYAWVLGGALILAAVTRHWRTAAVAALGLAFNLWPMTKVYSGSFPSQSSPEARPVRVVSLNVYVANRELDRVAAYLESLAPDLVVLQEVTTSSADRLIRLLPGLAHQYRAVDEGVRGVLVLSRWPLADTRRMAHGASLYGLRADVTLGDRTLRLYGLHLNWPLFPRAARGRNAQLAALVGELAACPEHCVVVGDFNTTPWSSHLRRLISASGFHDCAEGRGFLPTWPAFLPAPLRIRIDHCLASPSLSVADVQVGDSAGSDHLATINDLRVSHSPGVDASK